jgi:hypothetical protein
MNLRSVVPALGLIALSVTAASAQEIAKGVNLDGYVDVVGTGTTNSNSSKTDGSSVYPSTTDFSSEAVLKVGWSLADGKVNALISTRTNSDQGDLNLAEAYASVKATPEITVSAGKSYGPFGYYSAYATGLTTVTGSLTGNMYTVNPVGVWLAYAPTDKLTITAIVADGFSSQNLSADGGWPYRVNLPNNKVSKPGAVSPGLDIVFKPTSELTLNAEGFFDPSAGAEDASGKTGSVYYGAFNIEYKKDAILAAAEVLYQVNENNGKTNADDQKNMSWAAYVTYTLPASSPVAGAVTAQVSQYLSGETTQEVLDVTAYPFKSTFEPVEKDSITKAQLALLTNPFAVSQFGLNYELFYVMDDKKNNDGGKALDTFGFAIEGLYVIP